MNKKLQNSAGFESLMYQVLETELGGLQIYKAAIDCALNSELKEEWQEYLSETQRHVEVATNMLRQLGLDPDKEVAARVPVRITAEAMIKAMSKARSTDKQDGQLVAAECVVQAETKDHMNWELVGALIEDAKGEMKQVLKQAHDEVFKDETHHLYHTKGWARELWMKALALPSVLPPPEEIKHVETAIGAARAQHAREQML